jgi:hypothetical protein
MAIPDILSGLPRIFRESEESANFARRVPRLRQLRRDVY